MKRRTFLARVTAAAFMATPAMRAAAMVRDFGAPSRVVEFSSATWAVSPRPEVVSGILYHRVEGAATAQLIAEFEFDKGPIELHDDQTLTLSWNSEGILLNST